MVWRFELAQTSAKTRNDKHCVWSRDDAKFRSQCAFGKSCGSFGPAAAVGRESIAETPSLQDVGLFARLDDPTLHRLSIDAKIETFDDGAAIFRQGDAVAAFYIVVHGFVKILRIAPNGDETLITIRSDGDSLDTPPGPGGDAHRVSADALGAVCALKLPAARFVRAMQESPALADAMMRDSKARIATLIGEIESLKSQNADQRLARFILSLCPPGLDQCRFRLPYDKRHLAAQLGVTQETLSRAFAKLRDLGVRTETRAVSIDSVARLAAQCDDSGRVAPLHNSPREGG